VKRSKKANIGKSNGTGSDLSEASTSRMNASERIKLMKSISKLLGAENWSIVDLTLRQFKLPTSEAWSGENREPYVIAMIEKANDEALLELASHLGIESTPRPSALTPPFWREGFLRLFISHISALKADVANLKNWLESYNISGFIAHVDIEPTKKWQGEIELALNTADALVAVLTPGFHESKWTDQEIGFALGRGLLVISVKMGLDPYGFMGHEQALACGRELSLPIARQIFEIFLKHKQTQKRMSESLVSRFENSDSFADAKKNIGLLELAVYWDKQLSEAVAAAVEENRQINGSFGVPDRASALLNKRSSSG
jgi:TIR domain